eukprot:COSAG03_NODE_7566_length_899_cov_4.148750_1_plen_66_part_10
MARLLSQASAASESAVALSWSVRLGRSYNFTSHWVCALLLSLSVSVSVSLSLSLSLSLCVCVCVCV